MTQSFENMLYLFGANATGTKVGDLGELNIEEIRKFSVEQGVWTMVYPELAKLCDAKKYQMEFFTMVSAGVRRKEFTLGIIRRLEENGIKCCLLKGGTNSVLYADPECRISGDTDILITPEDEGKVSKLLLEYGYAVEERPANHHHMSARHKIGGLLEIHIRLYNDMTKKILFNDEEMAVQDWDTIEIQGCRYNTLSIRDNLMYLTAHYIKHLINSGGGVRQMMDLLLFIEKNKEKINFAEYDSTLKKLRYDRLIDVVKSVGGKYFGFDYKVKYEELMEKILNDTEVGGIFGHETENRNGFFSEFCKKRTTMSKTKTSIYVFLKKEGGYKWFPDRENLINQYGYKYAKYRILVPIAWIHRFIDVMTGKRRNAYIKKDTSEFAERMQMMRDLGMIN